MIKANKRHFKYGKKSVGLEDIRKEEQEMEASKTTQCFHPGKQNERLVACFDQDI